MIKFILMSSLRIILKSGIYVALDESHVLINEAVFGALLAIESQFFMRRCKDVTYVILSVGSMS